MEFNKRELNLRVDGQAYKIAYPSVKQIKQYQGKFGAHKDDAVKSIEAVQNFLKELGLPTNVSDDLEPSALTTIIDEVSGVKKK